MKRRDIIKKLTQSGFRLERRGGNHDIYYNPKTGITVPVGRHREIDDILAKEILIEAGI